MSLLLFSSRSTIALISEIKRKADWVTHKFQCLQVETGHQTLCEQSIIFYRRERGETRRNALNTFW